MHISFYFVQCGTSKIYCFAHLA